MDAACIRSGALFPSHHPPNYWSYWHMDKQMRDMGRAQLADLRSNALFCDYASAQIKYSPDTGPEPRLVLRGVGYWHFGLLDYARREHQGRV